MFQKGGLYYADWRDEKGVRKRKSFPTALGAERHETKMKCASNPSGAAPLATPAAKSHFAETSNLGSCGGLTSLDGSSKSAEENFPSANSQRPTSVMSNEHGSKGLARSPKVPPIKTTTSSGGGVTISQTRARPISATRLSTRLGGVPAPYTPPTGN